MKKIIHALACTLVVALTVISCTPKPTPLSKSEMKIHSNPAHKFVLPNGLTLLVQEDHSSPVASVQAWCNAGSITEGEYLGCGISHILEHMLFKGTSRRGNSEIALSVQNAGGYVNAYTSFDRTVFYINLPSAGWQTGVDVLADAMFHSTLPEDQYAKEQEVIRREFAMGEDDPDRALSKLLFATAYAVHPYKYPVIGHLELYNKLTRQNVLDYYHKHYIPNNLTFVVTGDVNADEVYQFLLKATGDIERKVHDPAYIPQEPPQLGEREAEQHFPTDVTRTAIAWHIPGITDPDIYALDVLAVIAGDGTSSRFYRSLVEEQKLLRAVDVFSYTPTQGGIWAVSATLLPDDKITPEQVKAAVLKLVEQLKDSPVSAEELEKARRKAIVARAGDLKTVSGLAASLGTSWFVAHDLTFSDTYLERLQQVTAGDLQRVARKYLTTDNRTVVNLLPENVSGSKPVETAKQQSYQLEQTRLQDGAILVMKQDAKVPLVTVRAILNGGLLTENAANNGIGSLTIRLLNKGTKTRTAEQIANQVEDLGGSFAANSGNNSMSISIEVLQDDVDKAVELLSDILLNPAFPEAELAKEKNKQLADIKLEADEPMALARNALRGNLFGSHPYGLRSLGTVESVGKITREDIVNYYRSLLRPSTTVFTISGSFDPATAVKLFDAKFPASAFASDNANDKPAEVKFGGSGQTIVVPTSKKQAIVEIGYPGVTISDADRPALEMIDEALSDLASRLFIRIREKQSLAYFVGTNQMLAVKPGYFMFYAGTEATKGEKVQAELLDEIHNIATNGLTKEEIERARAKLLGQRLLQDQSADVIAYKAGLNVLYGLGLNYENELNDKIKSLTVEQFNAVAKKYFSANNYVCVIVKPE
ncbi:MAG: insulinase family protein [Verrucomicrobiales bacterium]|jgi:zinc protease|nr:insulinase family protein [Verrucomicrobiales bacterium]